MAILFKNNFFPVSKMSETMWPNGVPAFGKEMRKEFFLGQDGVHEQVSEQ